MPRMREPTRPWYDTPSVRRVLVIAALLGIGLGVQTVVLHATMDPLADLHAYVDAASRLNAGLPLYGQPAGTDDAAFYRYPPLLAVVFRPIAALPFEVVAVIWEAILVMALLLTIVRLGAMRPATWVLIGMLALPIAWSFVIGQAHILVTLLLAVGAPWSVALAAHLKLFPALAAIWWIGRRDWASLARFVGWLSAFTLLQLVVEPAGSLAYPAFIASDQIGAVNSISPFAVSPILWVVIVAGLAVTALRFARSPLGWPLAIAFAVFAAPRLLVYQVATLVAGLRAPDDR